MSRILVTLFVLASALTVQAQDDSGSSSSAFGITHSIYGGFNMSKIKIVGVDNDDIEYGSGADVGYSLVVPFGNSFALRTGAGVSRRSAVIDTGILLFGDLTIKLTYIEVPVTAYIPFGSGVVSGLAGVNVAFFVSDDCEVDFGTCTTNSDDYKDVVTNAVLGARFRLGSAASRHNLEAYFETGITDIDNDDTKLELGHSVRYVYNF